MGQKQVEKPVKRTGISRVIKRNIRTIVKMREEAEKKRTLQERIADAFTRFSGSMGFVYLHIAWFAIWIAINDGMTSIPPFDPFPYGLLTMIVSLEAIFLSTFVLISQNRMSKTANEQAELDLQINLLTEHEMTRVLLMLDDIQEKLGIKTEYDQELEDLQRETKPEEVLNEIERHQDNNK